MPAAHRDKALDIFESDRPAKLSPFRFQIALLLTALTGFSLLYGPGTGHKQPAQRAPLRDPMTLAASANDPQMIAAIHVAQATARAHSGGNAWTKPKSAGPTATFATPGGSITLSRSEIADANSIYPHFVARAKHPRDGGTVRRSAAAGFDSEFSDRSAWGN